MTRLIVGPFNRVEGDLEVKIDIQEGQVANAYVVSPMYRGFEQMLTGKDPRDALVVTPRICGICSVSQSVAAAAALADLTGVTMPRNGQLLENIIHGVENIADHLTHFYLFFMPDFTREIYKDKKWFEQARERFAPLKGSIVQEVLPARANLMHITGLLAGKWPHTMTIQPGGSTKAITSNKQVRLISIIRTFRQFLETRVFGCSLDDLVSLRSLSDLNQLVGTIGSKQSDFAQFIKIADDLELATVGVSGCGFLSFGAYKKITDDQEIKPLFARGCYKGGQIKPLDQAGIREDVSNSWMEPQDKPLHPFKGVTKPAKIDETGYSWCKAPRLNNQPFEVGALARQLIDEHALIQDISQKQGLGVKARIIARLVELALLTLLLEQWIGEIDVNETFIAHETYPKNGRGFGLVEAARGALGHWVEVEKGGIKNYQIIAPTSWNFSPRDEADQKGPLERALIGAKVQSGETEPVMVQHIVRSFDPCMVCTVH